MVATTLLLPLLTLTLLTTTLAVPEGWDFPTSINLRAGVLHAPPFAILEKQYDGTIKYSGFQPDLLERLKIFAQQDGVSLNFELAPSPPNFNPALDLVANDCNTTKNPNSLEECQKFDLIVANYYATPARCTRVNLSPPWAKSTITTLKYLDKPEGETDYTTLKQAEDAGAPICVKGGTFFATVVKARFPNGVYVDCPTLEACTNSLKKGDCVLSAEDELVSRYSQTQDPSLEVTREAFNTQYKVWPFSYAVPFETRLLMEKWLRDANTNATLDELYGKYFQKSLCPVGTAGENCDLPCDPIHGTSDKRGVCVCESTKWTGDDCSEEVPEELNLIPTYMIVIAYTMLGINVVVIALCAVWLFWQRNSAQVRVSQPFFLGLVLVGCLISSSTIYVLSLEHEGDGPVHACMAIPWLYSIGFSITFGTLFAKIRRVYFIFKNAAASQGGSRSRSRNNAITAEETFGVIAVVLLVDCIILICWTAMDPLHWEREVISADKFGLPLESQGACVSDNWLPYAAALTALHLVLMGTACYLCYLSRDIPTRFSEGKYVSIAMISNLQIFVVGVPILIIIGTEPATSFFVRSTIIWMNDLAVVVLLFGNLIYNAHFKPATKKEAKQDEVKEAVARIAKREKHKSRGHQSDLSSTAGAGMVASVVPRQSKSMFQDESLTEQPLETNNHNHIPPPKSPKSPKRVKKPVDVLKNTNSWGISNLSAWVPSQRGSQVDDSSRVSDDAPLPPMKHFSDPSRKPIDVLANNKQSWAGLSQVDANSILEEDSEHDQPARSSSRRSGGSKMNEDSQHSTSSRPRRNRSHGSKLNEDSQHSYSSRRSYELAPASLPKEKPAHMNYVEDRITRLRGEHAQKVAARRLRGHGSNSTLGSTQSTPVVGKHNRYKGHGSNSSLNTAGSKPKRVKSSSKYKHGHGSNSSLGSLDIRTEESATKSKGHRSLGSLGIGTDDGAAKRLSDTTGSSSAINSAATETGGTSVLGSSGTGTIGSVTISKGNHDSNGSLRTVESATKSGITINTVETEGSNSALGSLGTGMIGTGSMSALGANSIDV